MENVKNMSNPVTVNNIWLPLSCVGVLIAVGIAWGSMYQKVEGLREQMTDLKSQIAAIDGKLDRVLYQKSNVSLR